MPDFSTSLSLYERATIIPGRSLTRSKAPGRFGRIGEVPLYCDYGDGPYLVDVDGNRYIDMLCALGAISLGYRVSTDQFFGCGVYSLPHASEGWAGELVLKHVAPWATSVRFTKTGSEATHAAYRIAKAATGRHTVLMGDWAYHGWHEWTTHVPTYAHGSHLDEWRGREHTIAAIFYEPHRWEAINAEWLEWLQVYCDRFGILLVFDEMIYGGRWAIGGATEYHEVVPDLACYGKAFGNGQSVAFVVGGRELEEHGEIVSGTYSGDVDGLEAVVRTIETYTTRPVIKTLWNRGRQLQEGLRAAGIPVEGAPVHQRIKFASKEQGLRFGTEMAQRGVLWQPDVTNIMYAHTEAIIDQVIAAAIESWNAVQA